MIRSARTAGFQFRALPAWRRLVAYAGTEAVIIGSSVLMALLIFVLDMQLDVGIVVGVLYLVVLWIASYAARREVLWIAALGCLALVATEWLALPAQAETRTDSVTEIYNYAGVLLVVALAALGLDERRKGEIATGKLAAIFSSTDDAVIGNTLDGTITFWNEAAERLYGYTAEEIIGSSISRLAPPENPHEPLANLARVGRGERVDRQQTVRMGKDGQPRHVSLTVSPIIDGRGRNVGVSSIGHDIGNRLRLEEEQEQNRRKIAELNRELETSNADLRQFAHVACHDLQAPLLRVQGFARLLPRQCGDDLPDKAKDSLRRMLTSLARMQSMVRDLLEFSQVGSGAKPFQRVDIEVTMQSVIDDLATQISESGATIEIGSLPVVEGDLHLLHRLFQNLISNALKFRVSGRTPRILISAKEPGAGAEFCDVVVSDNGIGFRPEQAESLFETFRRLGGEDAYEGTGIGLAVCRRIVMHHGGAITASGDPGKGSAFAVSLPLPQSSAGCTPGQA